MAPRPLRRRDDLATTGFQRHRAPAHLAIVLAVATAAAVASLAGWGVASLIGRTTRRPRATWVVIATAATVVSLSMPFSGHGLTVTQRVALACMHLAVAAVLIPVLAATLPAQRRSARTDAGRLPAGDTARPASRTKPPLTRPATSPPGDPTTNIARPGHADKSEPRLVELLGA